jgi:hypothetical protein
MWKDLGKRRTLDCFFRDARFIAIDSFYFWIIFLQTPAIDIVYEEIKPIFPSAVRLEPAGSVTLQATRGYFEVKGPSVMIDLDVHVDQYLKYRSEQKGQED